VEFCFQILLEADLHVVIRRAGGRCFVVNLEADDGRIVLVVLEDFANHALAIKPVGRIQQVGILAQAIIKILTAEPRHHDFRMFLVHPRGNRIGRCAHDDANSRRVQLVYHAVHPGRGKLSVLRLPHPPARFPDANDGDARLLHELNVPVQPVVGHVFRIIGDAVKHGVHPVWPKCVARLRIRESSTEGHRASKSPDPHTLCIL
jgi:hypothetical protein